jgi:hypothetical protein
LVDNQPLPGWFRSAWPAGQQYSWCCKLDRKGRQIAARNAADGDVQGNALLMTVVTNLRKRSRLRLALTRAGMAVCKGLGCK